MHICNTCKHRHYTFTQKKNLTRKLTADMKMVFLNSERTDCHYSNSVTQINPFLVPSQYDPVNHNWVIG